MMKITDVVVQELEALKTWEELKPKVEEREKYNEIKLDNRKIIQEEGKPDEINRNFGKIFATTIDQSTGEETTEEIDISTAEFYPVLFREQVSAKFDDKLGKSPYFCNETDDLDYIQIKDTKTKDVIAEGSYWDLRVPYELSSTPVVYVFYNNNYYRWKLKVGDFNIPKKLVRDINRATKPHNFKISSIKAQVNGMTNYNRVEFALSTEIPATEAIKHVQNVKGFLHEYYMNRMQEVLDEEKQPEQEVYEEEMRQDSDLPF